MFAHLYMVFSSLWSNFWMRNYLSIIAVWFFFRWIQKEINCNNEKTHSTQFMIFIYVMNANWQCMHCAMHIVHKASHWQIVKEIWFFLNIPRWCCQRQQITREKSSFKIKLLHSAASASSKFRLAIVSLIKQKHGFFFFFIFRTYLMNMRNVLNIVELF